MAKFSDITGRYLYLDVDGTEYRVYVEQAGPAFPWFASTQPVPMAASIGIYSKIRISRRGFGWSPSIYPITANHYRRSQNAIGKMNTN